VDSLQRGENLIVGCSALKQRYRDTLNNGVAITWVYLKGSEELIRERLQQRKHHFMKPGMLASQFADLDEPTDAIVVDVAAEPSVIVAQIVNALPAQAKAS
jgi:gluconokinase